MDWDGMDCTAVGEEDLGVSGEQSGSETESPNKDGEWWPAGLTALSEHDRRHGIEILRDNVAIGGGKGVSWELEMKARRNSSGEVSSWISKASSRLHLLHKCA